MEKKEKSQPLKNWKENLKALTKELNSTVKKIDFYKKSKRVVPVEMFNTLKKLEDSLDDHLNVCLKKNKNLKDDVLSDVFFNEESINEFKLSYERILTFKKGNKKNYSRLFFFPFVYGVDVCGNNFGLIDFNNDSKNILTEFIEFFLKEKTNFNEFNVSVLDEAIIDWEGRNIEINLPIIHEATLFNKKINWEKDFPNEVCEKEESNWKIGLHSISIETDKEEWLKELNFFNFEEEFIKEFDIIFNSSGEKTYGVPCSPLDCEEYLSELLWLKQIDLQMEHVLSKPANPNHEIHEIEIIYHWIPEENHPIAVSVLFKSILTKKIKSIETLDDLSYFKRITRGLFFNENVGDVVSEISGSPLVWRPDVTIITRNEWSESFFNEDED